MTKQARLDALVAAFTELGPAWAQWVTACMPSPQVSYIRMRLLRALQAQSELTMKELATELHITQRRVTALVDALERDGFVARNAHPTDGRSTIVSLTGAGHRQQDVNWQQQQAEIGRAFAELSAEHQQQLLTIAPLLTDALRRVAAERPDDAIYD